MREYLGYLYSMGVDLCLQICGTSKIEDILLLCFSFISVDVIKK